MEGPFEGRRVQKTGWKNFGAVEGGYKVRKRKEDALCFNEERGEVSGNKISPYTVSKRFQEKPGRKRFFSKGRQLLLGQPRLVPEVGKGRFDWLILRQKILGRKDEISPP